MPLRSKTAVRVTDIPPGTTKEQFCEFVNHLFTTPSPSPSPWSLRKSHPNRFRFGKHKSAVVALPASSSGESSDQPGKFDTSSSPNQWHEHTFVKQGDFLVGTISFADAKSKAAVLQSHECDTTSTWKHWRLTDIFDYLTVLSDAGVDAEVDICAVHGLGGNAMDTWTAVTNKSAPMWLRDFLPMTDYFSKSRIMVFGYDSDLTDRRTMMRIEDWAQTLLDCINRVRARRKDRYFLSAILWEAWLYASSNIDGISLEQCGLLFLATPHSGTTKGDWWNFVTAAADVVAGVRPETVDALKSFNPASVWDKEQFFRLQPTPPFRCFAEGRKMAVRKTNQHIVTQASASLDSGKPAQSIMGADHSSICKFVSNADGAYGTIISALNTVAKEVSGRDVRSLKEQERIAGHPSFVAHAYPPSEHFWWEANQLNGMKYHIGSENAIVGRDKELRDLEELISSAKSTSTLTAIKGIGGIGKTRLLVEFAVKQKGLRSVFFLRANECLKFEDAVGQIAASIGFDMLKNRQTNGEVWNNMSISERVQIFLDWLGEPCNKDSLFVIDDLDAYEAPIVQQILQSPAGHILVSTRDSTLRWFMSPPRLPQEVRLPALDNQAIVSILKSTPIPPHMTEFVTLEMERIAASIHGHPLAARLAIPFIIDCLSMEPYPVEEFLQLFQSPDQNVRKMFFDYAVEGQCLWDCFETSTVRLSREDQDNTASSLLQLWPYLDSDVESLGEFFKLQKEWLRDFEKDIPHASILKQDHRIIFGTILRKLQKVSIFGPAFSSFPLNLHPLVQQFYLLRSANDRINLLRETIILCYQLATRNQHKESLIEPHVQHCLRICMSFEINLETLTLPEGALAWLNHLDISSLSLDPSFMGFEEQPGPENPFGDPVYVLDPNDAVHEEVDDFISKCSHAQEEFDQAMDSGLKPQIVQVLLKPIKSFNCIKGHFENDSEARCQLDVRESVASLIKMVHQAQKEGLTLYPNLLEDLQSFIQALRQSNTPKDTIA